MVWGPNTEDGEHPLAGYHALAVDHEVGSGWDDEISLGTELRLKNHIAIPDSSHSTA